jgi:hypothetical protein
MHGVRGGAHVRVAALPTWLGHLATPGPHVMQGALVLTPLRLTRVRTGNRVRTTAHSMRNERCCDFRPPANQVSKAQLSSGGQERTPRATPYVIFCVDARCRAAPRTGVL